MLRTEIAVEFLGGAWGTVPVDLAPEESSASASEMIPGISLEPFDLEGPAELPCLSLPHHIAQMIHGMTRPSTASWVNDRERDLIDLILLEGIGVDLQSVREACQEVFELRGTHPWPPRGQLPEAWEEPVMALVEELGLTIASYREATTRVLAFIQRIEAAIR